MNRSKVSSFVSNVVLTVVTAVPAGIAVGAMGANAWVQSAVTGVTAIGASIFWERVTDK